MQNNFPFKKSKAVIVYFNKGMARSPRQIVRQGGDKHASGGKPSPTPRLAGASALKTSDEALWILADIPSPSQSDSGDF